MAELTPRYHWLIPAPAELSAETIADAKARGLSGQLMRVLARRGKPDPQDAGGPLRRARTLAPRPMAAARRSAGGGAGGAGGGGRRAGAGVRRLRRGRPDGAGHPDPGAARAGHRCRAVRAPPHRRGPRHLAGGHRARPCGRQDAAPDRRLRLHQRDRGRGREASRHRRHHHRPPLAAPGAAGSGGGGQPASGRQPLPGRAPVRCRRGLQGRPAAAGRPTRRPRQGAGAWPTWRPSAPSPTWCRWRARTGPSAGSGWRLLADDPRPGLAALLASARVDPRRMDRDAISFGLAPRINALGRVGDAAGVAELLLAR